MFCWKSTTKRCITSPIATSANRKRRAISLKRYSPRPFKIFASSEATPSSRHGYSRLPRTGEKNRFKYLKRRGYFANKGQTENNEDRDEQQRIVPDYSTNPETLLAGKQVQRLVQKAIDELDPDHKEIVILRDIEGFSYEEIAQLLNLPEGTTKSRLHRARMVVKEKLKRVLS